MIEYADEQKLEQRLKYAQVHAKFLIDSCEQSTGYRRTDANGRMMIKQEIMFRKRHDTGLVNPKGTIRFVKNPQYVYDIACDIIDRMGV